MALRGTLTHRKTRRLAQALSIPPCFALGILESLWHVTGEQAADGAIGRMTDEDLAMEMFYDGDAQELVEALVTSGLVDRHPIHRLIVHDWHLHSDDATDNRLSRATKIYASGAFPRMTKLSKEERVHTCARFSTAGHKMPLPEPVPVPVPVDNPPNPPLGGMRKHEARKLATASVGMYASPAVRVASEEAQKRSDALALTHWRDLRQRDPEAYERRVDLWARKILDDEQKRARVA